MKASQINAQFNAQLLTRVFKQIDYQVFTRVFNQISAQVFMQIDPQVFDQIEADQLTPNPQLLVEARAQMTL